MKKYKGFPHECSLLGDARLLQRMLDEGADFNFGSANGWTPLLAAAWRWKLECVALLLERGADIDANCLSKFPRNGEGVR